ncbi:MAG: hypothetical protein ACKN9T_08455 [Candidatus Methylumidiphilus sp.]
MPDIQPTLDNGTPRKGRSFYVRLGWPLSAGLGLLALVGLCLWAYWPGLDGPFLFDDFANLSALGDFGRIEDWHGLVRYLKGGIAGPTGRPISLLSFLLNDTSWPSQPWSFKYTNLLIHALNGVLVFWCCLKIVRLNSLPSLRENAEWLALAASGLWLLHPLHVSTTLYVVQRMAMLSALFSICGILLYLWGRELMQTRPASGHALMAAALGPCTLLAVLSKENGVLLPVLLGVIEFTALRQQSLLARHPDRTWTLLCFGVPTAVLLLYLGRMLLPGHAGAFAPRGFTAVERGLTEARILLTYLYDLLIPKLYSGSLFNDDYPISHGLLTPPATLWSLAALAVLVWLACRMRRAYPLFSLAVLFFLAGHALESTVVPLDLYYEHRNYLPAVFLFLPLAYVPVAYRKLIACCVLGMLAIMLGFTAAKAKLWSSEPELLLYWAAQHPDSARAQRYAANVYYRMGMHGKALDVLAAATQKHPKDLKLRLHRMVLNCQIDQPAQAYFNETLRMMKTTDVYFDSQIFDMLDQLVSLTGQAKCQGMTLDLLDDMLATLIANPTVKGNISNEYLLAHMQGAIETQRKHGAAALAHFSKALKLSGDPETGMVEVALLAGQGLYSEALSHLQSTENMLLSTPVPTSGILAQHDYPAEIGRLRRNLQEDLARQPASIQNWDRAP